MIIEGCRILITGASGGIGTALIKIFSVLTNWLSCKGLKWVNSDLELISGNNIRVLQKEFSVRRIRLV